MNTDFGRKNMKNREIVERLKKECKNFDCYIEPDDVSVFAIRCLGKTEDEGRDELQKILGER